MCFKYAKMPFRSVKALLAKLQNLMVFHWFSIWSEKVLEAAALHT